jgi:hypothetical protein
VLLSLFYRFIDSNLDLHILRKKTAIAAVTSAVQGSGFWFSGSLLHGDPFRRLVIPGAIAGIIYWLAHFADWTSRRVTGVA